MGRNTTVEELLAQAKANGYKRGAHIEQDRVKKQGKHGDKAKVNQDGTLRRYVRQVRYRRPDLKLPLGAGPG